MKVKCLHCGKEFEKVGKQTYCSRDCYQQAWYKKHYVPMSEREGYKKQEYVNKCEHCGKEFETTQKTAKYCSSKCRERAALVRKRPIKYCLVCGSEVPYEEGKHTKYCSDTCWKLDHTKICQECGKEFIPTKHGHQRYCSHECAQNAQKDKTVYICKQCGKSFMRRKRGEDQCLFCSRKCAKEYLVRQYTATHTECDTVKKRREYRIRANGKPDFSINLQMLYERDHGICAICGKPVNMETDTCDNEYGSIDHIIPLAKGGTHTWDNVQLAHRICNSRKGAA